MQTCVYCGTITVTERSRLIPRSWRLTSPTVPCCTICNRAKGNGLFDSISHVAEYLYQNLPDHPCRDGLKYTASRPWAKISFENPRRAAAVARRETIV